MKICPNQHTDLLRLLFTEDSLKIKKDLELVSGPNLLNITQPVQLSSPDCVYFPSYRIKCVSCFMLRHLMTS